MEIRYEQELANNDLEYQAGLIANDNSINNIIESPPPIYNPANFQPEVIIKYFQSIGFIDKVKNCPKCGDMMNICKRSDTIDKISWRCHKRNPAHDAKINIRHGTIFENFQIKIQILYFLIYYCFIENMSLSSASEKTRYFCQQICEIPPTINIILKFFNVLRDKLRVHMHAEWETNLLGLKINNNLGYSSVEIDESKIISSGNLIFWMFGIIDRNTKEARVRCVLDNRTKENLLPLIEKYVYTNDLNEDDNDSEDVSLKTRVFSDCFRAYRVSEFNELGYILKRVNHSIWFGAGYLHTNTIESLWHQIKMITNNFSGLNIEKLKTMFNNNENAIKDYLDGWICYSLCLRSMKNKKLGWSDKINFINHNLI